MGKGAQELLLKFTGDPSGARNALDAVGGGLTSTGDKAHKLSGKMRLAGAAMLAAGAAVAGYIAKTTIDFDKSMSKVQALSGATADEFGLLRQAAIDLGSKTVYSATEASEGMSILAAAGLKTNDVLAAMPGMLTTAAAAGADFAVTSDIMVSTMSQFNMKASDFGRIGDVLAQAANQSTASIEDMGLALKYVGPVSSTLGFTLEDTAAAIATLANAGIKADSAGTTLRMAFIRLAKPPKQAEAAMKRLNFSLTDMNGAVKPLPDILEELHGKFAPLTAAQKLETAAMLFGTEAASGMLKLIEAGGPKFDAMAASMDNASGSANKVASDMTNNMWGAIEQIKGSLESGAITIGTAFTPALRSIADALPPLIDKITALAAQHGPALAQLFTNLGSVATSALIPAIGTVADVLSDVLGLFLKLPPQAQANIVKFGLLASAAHSATGGNGIGALLGSRGLGGVLTKMAGISGPQGAAVLAAGAVGYMVGTWLVENSRLGPFLRNLGNIVADLTTIDRLGRYNPNRFAQSAFGVSPAPATVPASSRIPGRPSVTTYGGGGGGGARSIDLSGFGGSSGYGKPPLMVNISMPISGSKTDAQSLATIAKAQVLSALRLAGLPA